MALFDFVKKKKGKKTDRTTVDVQLSGEKDKAEKIEAVSVSSDSKQKEKVKKAKVDKIQTVSVGKKVLQPNVETKTKVASGERKYAFVLRNPRITEKATMLSVRSIYTFDVFPKATKLEVKKAIEELYNVTPVKIRMINIPSKTVFVRRQKGTKSRGKKAMVYLREGETIEFV